MNCAHSDVRAWLEATLGGPDNIPDYEVNEVSLALLARMAEECASADAALCASAALKRRQAAEYAAEADRTEATLTRLGLASQQV